MMFHLVCPRLRANHPSIIERQDLYAAKLDGMTFTL
jgi:hypothetical protein